MTAPTLTQSPPSDPHSPGRRPIADCFQSTGGPGAAEPAEMPDAEWVSPAPTRAPQSRSPDAPVLPVRAIPGAWGYAGVSAILDARDRTIAMARNEIAASFVEHLNSRGV